MNNFTLKANALGDKTNLYFSKMVFFTVIYDKTETIRNTFHFFGCMVEFCKYFF